MNSKWDVVIVGAGLAGYVAANYLAKSNLKVLILEKAKKVGGRARTAVFVLLAPLQSGWPFALPCSPENEYYH